MVVNTGVHYNMGTSQKFSVHIPTFVHQNHSDPAVKVSSFNFATVHALSYVPLEQNFFSKLREHLLPCIQVVLQLEAEFCPELSTRTDTFLLGMDDTASNSVYFKNESLYQHKIIRFNFTTYDMQ